MASLEEYRKAQRDLRAALQKLDELRGKAVALRRQVKEEWGTDNVTELRLLIAKELESLEERRRDYQERVTRFWESYHALLVEEED